MNELIARLEEATGDTRKLFYEVLVHAHRNEWITDGPYDRCMKLLEVGAFLEIAVALVPEGWEWSVDSDGGCEIYQGVPSGMLPGAPGSTVASTYGSTPPIALCIAAIKAREAG